MFERREASVFHGGDTEIFSVYGVKNLNSFRFGVMLTLLAIFAIGIIVGNRELVLRFFIVEIAHTSPPDLLVLLEGGDLRYSPTRERVDRLMELYKRRPTKVLVCSAPQHKRTLTEFLITDGVKPSDMIESKYPDAYDNRGGTYANVLEILNVLRANKDLRVLEIVTSPYHEKRVQIITSRLLAKSGMEMPVRIRFAHIDGSDIYRTDRQRYLTMIGHEILGIAGFYVQTLVAGLENLWNPNHGRIGYGEKGRPDAYDV